MCSTLYKYIRRRLVSCNSVSLEVTLALIIFIFALFVSNPIAVIIDILYFIIILEVIRTVVEYVRSAEHRVKIRYLVDATIVATLREIIIITVDHEKLVEHIYQLSVFGISFFVMLFARYLVMKYSPDSLDESFNKCRNIN